jgi:hypothetical protein
VENHKQVFHFPTRAARRQLRFICSGNQKPNTPIGRFAASLISSQDHVVLEMLAIQKTPCRDGHRRGTTSSVLVAGSLAGFEVTLYGRF